MPGHVSGDESPLRVYLALPAGAGPTLIHDASAPGASILELGCGPGRLTRVLTGYGHRVTAVDDSAEMLEHVTGAETVLAELTTLDLGRRFDTVIATSGLVNRPTTTWRQQLLDVCRRHVTDDGVVIVERYAPGDISTIGAGTWQEGPVQCRYRHLRLDDGVVTAVITYRLGTDEWRQRVRLEDVSDEQFTLEAAGSGFGDVTALDDARRWMCLRPRAEPA